MRTKEQLKTEEKPSFLIRDALEALEIAEKSKTINVDMSRFLDTEDNVCFTCLGSAQRLKRMGLLEGTLEEIVEQAKVHKVDSIEHAIEGARLGLLSDMFMDLRLGFGNGKKFDRDIPPYTYIYGPAEFKRQMNTLADYLEAAGW